MDITNPFHPLNPLNPDSSLDGEFATWHDAGFLIGLCALGLAFVAYVWWSDRKKEKKRED